MILLQVSDELAEPGTEAGGNPGAFAIVMPHLDDLAVVAGGSGVQVEAMMISCARVGERYPFRMPPVSDDAGSIAFVVDAFEFVRIQQVFPASPLIAKSFEGEPFPSFQEKGRIGGLAVVTKIGETYIFRKGDTQVLFRFLDSCF